jgi:hypothetical protein
MLMQHTRFAVKDETERARELAVQIARQQDVNAAASA